MAKGEQRGNREAKKPKKEKPKQLRRPHPLPNKIWAPLSPGRAPERSRGASARDCRWPTGRGWPDSSRRFITSCTNRSRAEQTSAIYPEETRINGSISLKATFR
jgi:hypothetical protein